MSTDPFANLDRLIQVRDCERLEHSVEAYGEILVEMHRAMLVLRDELRRLQRGDPPSGTEVRY